MSPRSDATKTATRLAEVVNLIGDLNLERDKLVIELHTEHGRSLRYIAELVGMTHQGVAAIIARGA